MLCVILESKRTALVLSEDRHWDMYYSWPKVKYQVNGVSGSRHKKFSTLNEVVDSFTVCCTFKAR